MYPSESDVLKVLRKYSPSQYNWKFFECVNSSGKTEAQGKFYSDLGYWVAYPDFECYENEKLIMLVEVKGLFGFFDGEDGKLGMKYRNFKSYQRVRAKENVDVRICFVVKYQGKKVFIWESVDNISYFPCSIKDRTYFEWDYEKQERIEKKDKFIIWDAVNFRTDENNLPIP